MSKDINVSYKLIPVLVVFLAGLATMPVVEARYAMDGYSRPTRRTYTPPKPKPKPSPPPRRSPPRYERPPRRSYSYTPPKPKPKPTPPPAPKPAPTLSPAQKRFLQKEAVMEKSYTSSYGSTTSPTTSTYPYSYYGSGGGGASNNSTRNCGGAYQKSCGTAYDPTNYYANGNPAYNSGANCVGSYCMDGSYNPLVGTNSSGSTGWWAAGNVANSGYTIAPTSQKACGGSSSTHQCFQITNKDGTPGQAIWVSDARVAVLERQAANTGYYAGSEELRGTQTYTLTTTSWPCGGSCCYDSGWKAPGGCGAATAAKGGGGGGKPPVTPPPGCTNSAPSKPAIAHPTDGDTVAPTDTITLTWSLGTWGTACTGNNNNFFLTVLPSGGGAPIQIVLPTSKYDLPVTAGTSYEWFVVASNGTGSRSSDHATFTVSDTSLVSGYISDLTGVACPASPAQKEIAPDDLSGGVAVAVGALSGTWDPASFDNHSYEVEDVGYGTGQIVCANVSDPADKPNFRYVLNCVNGTDTGVISGSCASVDISSASTTANLGYRLSSTGWFTSLGGDVFGGCDESNCASSISVGIPDAGDILGGFAEYLVDRVGTVFADSGLSISNDAYSADNDRRLEFMASENPWPSTFSFDAPESANSVSNCDGMFGNLAAGEVYEASTSCVQDGLDNLSGSYSVSGSGVAVVYVSGTDTLDFEKDFVSGNSNRILFITQGSVRYDSALGTAAPDTSTSPSVQASVIAEQSINFESTGSQDDTTLVVEGPLVTKDGEVSFDRDRGLQNGFPAEVVVYNPTYLVELTNATPAGVSSVDISWVIQN